jgi:hypothetical protein
MTKRRRKSSGRSWKMERASVRRKGSARARSNKYRPASDQSRRPAPGTRKLYWRGGYTRKDGVYVRGHYVRIPKR